jgi:serine/threonine protein kinase
MNKISSLQELGINWQGTPRQWNFIDKKLIPICDSTGKVTDVSGNKKFTLVPKGTLGKGTFGVVDSFLKEFADGTSQIVALKRSNHKSIHLLMEGLFQWKLQKEMEIYGLGFCIPEVYDILRFQVTGDIWFTMKQYEPYLLSQWCVENLEKNPKQLFALLLLQIALVLEVFENKLFIDHRDLKVNNILVCDEPVTINFKWKTKEYSLRFPFRIIFVDFGFACQRLLDLREGDGLPPVDPCPKVGRDIFQVLASIWSIKVLRGFLDAFWGGWIRERLRSPTKSYATLAENTSSLDWMYILTDTDTFCAPNCAPTLIIEDCLSALEG